jgi:chromosomal replication initiator protein
MNKPVYRWEMGNNEKPLAVMDEVCIIFETVCNQFSVTKYEVRGKERENHIVNARMIIAYILRNKMHWTFERIGDELGDRDHSTICNLIKRMENCISVRSWVYSHYLEIMNKISAKKAA